MSSEKVTEAAVLLRDALLRRLLRRLVTEVEADEQVENSRLLESSNSKSTVAVGSSMLLKGAMVE